MLSLCSESGGDNWEVIRKNKTELRIQRQGLTIIKKEVANMAFICVCSTSLRSVTGEMFFALWCNICCNSWSLPGSRAPRGKWTSHVLSVFSLLV